MKTYAPLEPLETRIAPAFAGVLTLADITSADGFKVPGVADNDQAGTAVSAAGDVNGDGFADFIIGARDADGRGAAYVVFGSTNGMPPLSSLDGTNGFKLAGATDGSFAGASVGAAGDLNGDGYDDVIVGAPLANEGGTFRGAAYVVFGRASFDATLSLAALNGATGFKLRGGADNDMTGSSVAGAGDVNGDGFADVIVGAEGAAEGGSERGAAFVVFGKAGGFSSALALTSLDGSNGFRLSGFSDSDHTGKSVGSAGDVNHDGFDDVVIGAPYANAGGNARGVAYVVFGNGSAFPSAMALANLDSSDGFTILGANDLDLAGYSVGGAGDVNGDGFADFIIGSTFADAGGDARGVANVVFGKTSSFGDSISLLTLDSTAGFKILGAANSDHAGFSVSGVGDVNGDGFSDVIIGAPDANEGGSNRGAAYVVFGRNDIAGDTISVSLLDGARGFKISGVANSDQAGFAVSAAGDVNGDGLGDFVVGALGANETGNDRGAAYVIYGQPDVVVKLAAGGKRATFIDADGDAVTVSVSKGRLARNDFDFSGGVWRGLNLADDGDEFAGAHIVVSVKKSPTGDGRVNLGAIHAEGIDLGSVRLPGDLGQIDAGDANFKTAGVKSIAVRSLGALGGTTQPQGTLDPVRSDIVGVLGTLNVVGDVKGAVSVTGGLGAKIGRVSIGGNLDGSGGDTFAGLLRAGDSIGAVKVKGSVIGGADFSGIIAGGKLGKVTIGGDLTSAVAAKPVVVSALGSIASVTVGVDVFNARILAGYTASIGAANPDASIGAVKIGGDWAASSIAAGVGDTGFAGYGIGDTLITGDTTPNVIATIASVVIKGTAMGSPGAGDHFGITAQRVAKVQIGSVVQVLTAGVDSLQLDTTNNDFRIRDFA